MQIQHLAYTEFTTRFAGGEVFNTLNSKESGSLPLPPKTMTVRAPWVADVGRLYEIHEAITVDGTEYRPTMRGAYLMTWRQLPSIKQFVAHRDRRRVERLLDGAGVGPPRTS